MSEPAYDIARRVSPVAEVVLQRNPGPMTLDGTSTWLLRAPGSATCVLVDPGEHDDAHLAEVRAAAGEVELVLVTHGHHDHVQAAPDWHRELGVPVRAADPQHCHDGAELRDGEVITAAGLAVRVLATPGHTSDSVCFVVGGADGADGADGSDGAVLTGDTILGRGTTVVAHPDGVLGPYLDSLRRLADLGPVPVLPGHGPTLPAVDEVARAYLRHRDERLEQVRAALGTLGADATARQIVELVYADVDRQVWWAAELSVAAQLDYLRG